MVQTFLPILISRTMMDISKLGDTLDGMSSVGRHRIDMTNSIHIQDRRTTTNVTQVITGANAI